MVDDRAIRRARFRERLAELKSAALKELEGRGYEVRGKTPGEIRRMLKRRHPNRDQQPSASDAKK